MILYLRINQIYIEVYYGIIHSTMYYNIRNITKKKLNKRDEAAACTNDKTIRRT